MGGGGVHSFYETKLPQRILHACWERLRGGLIRWGHPPSLTSKPKISWEDKSKYVKPKVNPSKRSRIHAVRVPHHVAVPISFSRVLRGLLNNIPFLPDTKLFATLQPLSNFGRLFHGWRTRALQKDT